MGTATASGTLKRVRPGFLPMLHAPPALCISRRAGPRTVLLHGMVMAPCFWKSYAPPVCRTGTAMAYPLPGHHPWSLGTRTATLSMDLILDAYARAMERDFGGEPVTLIGHSTGAFMALALAARRPSLIESLVLMGALSCGGMDGCQPFAMRLLRLPRFGQWSFERLLSYWISTPDRFIDGARACVADADDHMHSRRDRDAIEQVRQSLLASDPGEIAALVRLLSQTSLTDALADIACPALNIVGGMDRVIRPRHQFNIQSAMPAISTLLLPRAGHLPMVERPREVAAATRAFLRDPGSKRMTRPATEKPAACTAPDPVLRIAKPRDVSAPGSDGLAAPAG